MSLCVNPDCPKPQSPDNLLFCPACGSELLLGGSYRVARLLSDKGGFGKTYEVREDGTAKVLKLLTNNQPKAVKLFEQEARVLTGLNHPGIPRGEDAFLFYPRHSQTPLHCLVMEYIQGTDLEEYQKQRQHRPIRQKIALAWLQQLAEIIHAIHSQQLFHRDIKPSNIILKPDGQLVLIDFGAVRQVSATILARGKNTAIYTPGYAPPEQEKGYAVPESDFFALGRTLLYLLTGTHPMYLEDDSQNIVNWRPHAPGISSQLADFIDRLMEPSPDRRPKNTEALIQEIAQIKLALYPPPKSLSVPSTLVQPARSSPLPNNLPLSTFNFTVTTVNRRGDEINRQRHSAQFFTEDLGNGVNLEMVYIPGGSFMMGSPDGEGGDREKPQHRVTVPELFLGKYQITQAQWQAVMGNNNLWQAVMGNNPSYFKGKNLPVENVSWFDAVEFCQRLKKNTGRPYRFPTEAEWEYACRAGTETPFHFGATITSDLANYNGTRTYASEPTGKIRRTTTPVGTFPPNAFGLYDMHGNVWEWCQDTRHTNYQGAPTDGSAWVTNNSGDNNRLLRGGSWRYGSGHCLGVSRGCDGPGNGRWFNGFRLALSSAWTF